MMSEVNDQAQDPEKLAGRPSGPAAGPEAVVRR
jgi:hypothetical protein